MDAGRPLKLDARNVSLTHYNERMKQPLEVLRGIDLRVFEGELVSISGTFR